MYSFDIFKMQGRIWHDIWSWREKTLKSFWRDINFNSGFFKRSRLFDSSPFICYSHLGKTPRNCRINLSFIRFYDNWPDNTICFFTTPNMPKFVCGEINKIHRTRFIRLTKCPQNPKNNMSIGICFNSVWARISNKSSIIQQPSNLRGKTICVVSPETRVNNNWNFLCDIFC